MRTKTGETSLSESQEIDRAFVLKAAVVLLAVGFLLRIFYAGHLFQDDGLWFTAAEELLRGKSLYSEIYFDKPPALPLLYALLFKFFGAHILTVRLFTIFHAAAISAVLYLFGARLYDRRTGLAAAAMFTLFSTTYTTGHVQGLNTDFFMALPYTAAAYLFISSRVPGASRSGRGYALRALSAGLLAGVAAQSNPKGIFILLFFALFLVYIRCASSGNLSPSAYSENSAGTQPMPGALFVFVLALAGFLAGSLPFLIYVLSTGSFSAYLTYVWDWGAKYASYYPAWKAAQTALVQTANYFVLNSVLLAGLVFLALRMARGLVRARRGATGAEEYPGAGPKAEAMRQADATLLLWLATSYLAMAVGGRFFGHYFFQILPALCLIASRTLILIISAPGKGGRRGRAWVRPVGFALLALGLAVTVVRFHARTAVLAVDWARGSKGELTGGWLHERLNYEERLVAATVRGVPDIEGAARQWDGEAIRDGGPRDHGVTPADSIFVWGYRPEIYFWSGLIPASKYLSTQPLTGVPADVHYFGGQHDYVLDESESWAARQDLLRELEEARPLYIVDELSFFNNDLRIDNYPELHEFLMGYENLGVTGRFFIYRRKAANQATPLPEARP